MPVSQPSMLQLSRHGYMCLPTQGTADEGALQLPRLFPADFTLFPQQMWTSIPLHLWKALSQNGRQGMLQPSQHPAFVWEQRALTAALPLLSQPGKPQGPPSWPSQGGWDSHKQGRRSMAGFSCLFLKRRCWLSGCLSVCPMGSMNQCRGSAAWACVCEPSLSAASYSCWISK